MGVVIGRDTELVTLLECVDRVADSGPALATVVAPAGMGKSALAVAMRDAVLTRDATVLTARPLEAEGRLAFSALSELLADLPPEEYDALPPPQRSAIRSALLLDDGDGADPRAVALALRGVLAACAAARPLIILVDDAQWLDDASAAALGQSLPRLGDLPVLVVAWARPSGRALTSGSPTGRAPSSGLDPLPLSALFHVIREHLDVTLSRSELRAVAEASGGNPLHALEFARHRALGPGASFEALLTERLLALPRSTRTALLAAALCAAPTASRPRRGARSQRRPAARRPRARRRRRAHPSRRHHQLPPPALPRGRGRQRSSRGTGRDARRARRRRAAWRRPGSGTGRWPTMRPTRRSRPSSPRLPARRGPAPRGCRRPSCSTWRSRAARTLRPATSGRSSWRIASSSTAIPGMPSRSWPTARGPCRVLVLGRDDRAVQPLPDRRSLRRGQGASLARSLPPTCLPEDYANAVVDAEIDMLLGRMDRVSDSYGRGARRLAERAGPAPG